MEQAVTGHPYMPTTLEAQVPDFMLLLGFKNPAEAIRFERWLSTVGWAAFEEHERSKSHDRTS